MLRPLGVGEILEASFKLYFRLFRTLIACAAVLCVPLSVLAAVVTLATDPNAFTPDAIGFADTEDPEDIFGEDPWLFIAGQAGVGILTGLGTLLVTGACFRAVAAGYLGAPSTWQESFGFALRRLHSLVWVNVLVGLAVLVGLLACIVPGVWLYVSFGVVMPALLAEDLRGRKALRRSFSLVKGDWWHVFGVLFLAAMLTIVLTSIAAGAGAALTFLGPEDQVLNGTLQTIISAAAQTVALPFAAVVGAIVYFDLRVRKEGLDLGEIAARIGATLRSWQPQPVPPSGGFLPPRPPG
jgi:hypothetical protein